MFTRHIFIMVVLILLNCYDCMSTMFVLGQGIGVEGNPVMRHLIDTLGYWAYIIKMVLGTGVIMFIVDRLYSGEKISCIPVIAAFLILIAAGVQNTSIILGCPIF